LVLELEPGIGEADYRDLLVDGRRLGLELVLKRGAGFCFALARVQGDYAGLPERLTGRRGLRRAFLQEDEFVLASRNWHAEASRFSCRGNEVGGRGLAIIAGPCSVEDREQMLETALAVKEAGAGWLRGGAFKPRSNPYRFQGLGLRGLELLREAGDSTGLPVITEVLQAEDVELVGRFTDVFQVGSRSSQNFPLLRRLGRESKPVLLKRGFGCTLEELVNGAEYVMLSGNPRVILCERGVRGFDPSTRFTFDINALPLLKRSVHLPVVADPSHGTGDAGLVEAVALAAVAAGADGLMLEVHADPRRARSDGEQSITPEAFRRFMERLAPVAEAVDRNLRTAAQYPAEENQGLEE